MKRSILLRFFPPVLAVALLGFAVLQGLRQPPRLQAAPLLPASGTPFAWSVGGVGVVEPRSELVEIGTNIPGVVMSMRAEPGLAVKAGDPLFTVDDREARAQVAAARAELKSREVALADAKNQQAITDAVQDRRAVSQDDRDRRKYATLRAEAALGEAKARLDTAQTTLERLTVRSPIQGTVLRRNVKAGEYAAAGQNQRPLLILGDVSLWHVRVEVDEREAWRVRPEARAVGLLRGDPSKRVDLSFVRFEPDVRPKRVIANEGQRVDTRVLEVVYSFEPSKLAVFSGQQLDVFIETQPLPMRQPQAGGGS